jgi:hypothetical protein
MPFDPTPYERSGLPYRIDPLTGDVAYIVAERQGRPNLPASGCPFCPGGLEAPEPYDVFSFPNRWPAIPAARCEVVLYTSDHDATFWSLGVSGARKVVDLWAERTAALGARRRAASSCSRTGVPRSAPPSLTPTDRSTPSIWCRRACATSSRAPTSPPRSVRTPPAATTNAS